MVYAGISHLHLELKNIKKYQKLDNKIFTNVREGDWLLKYTIQRLRDSNGLKELANYLEINLYEHYKNIPVYLKPHYITKIIDVLYDFYVKIIFSKIEKTVNFLFIFINLFIL